MPYVTMDAAVIKELLSGQTDLISKELELERALYSRARCPNCGSSEIVKRLNPIKLQSGPDGPVVQSSPFSSKSPILQGYALCQDCGAEFYPDTGLLRPLDGALIDVSAAGSRQGS
jgi:hypothetical protein